MVFKNLSFLVLWTKVASALEGLSQEVSLLTWSLLYSRLYRYVSLPFTIAGGPGGAPLVNGQLTMIYIVQSATSTVVH